MCPSGQQQLITSRYNFLIPIRGGVLLYNANTGAVLRFEGADAIPLATALSDQPTELEEGFLENGLEQQLIAGGFLLPTNISELEQICERYWEARSATPLVITITTTMDCNLGCYYCYESRSGDRLAIKDVDEIVMLAKRLLDRSGKKTVHVDWYGGEPLMNLDFMERAAQALKTLCLNENVTYSASVISNGTCWPNDIGSFIAHHRIRQVQVSFDGLKANHDRRRRYRKEYVTEANSSSFEKAVDLVDSLLEHVRVDVRLNIDPGNQSDVGPFIEFARKRGWFARPFPAVLQPARLASYSEQSSFMRQHELSLDEYEIIRAQVRDMAGNAIVVEEAEAPDGFPYPKTSVCAALANDSVVVGADRSLYRCGLQVSEPKRAVGALSSQLKRSLPVLNNIGQGKSDNVWWDEFDPTKLPKCSRCSFLPICWGGCPKKHLEQDLHAIDEQGAYWRLNLPRLVAHKVKAEEIPGFMFSEVEQFR